MCLAGRSREGPDQTPPCRSDLAIHSRLCLYSLHEGYILPWFGKTTARGGKISEQEG